MQAALVGPSCTQFVCLASKRMSHSIGDVDDGDDDGDGGDGDDDDDHGDGDDGDDDCDDGDGDDDVDG